MTRVDAGDRSAAAASWFARLHADDVSDAEREAFAAWRSDRRNAEAYAAIERLWTATGADAASADVRALREEADALGRAGSQWHVGAAALVAVVLGFGGAAYWSLSTDSAKPARVATMPAATAAPMPAYSTAIGERSTVALADGSVVHLNTDSRLGTDYSPSERHVVLLEGQAFFEVATDAHRPFVVTAGDQRVTALGTAFDVRLREDRVQVTLIEGRVSVECARDSPARSPPRRAELRAGQQLIATGSAVVEVRDVAVARITSWREGRLILEDEPLAEAVEEMNRYSTTKIVLGDPALATLRVSGVFRTGQPRSFVEALTAYFPIETAPTPRPRAIVLMPRET